MKTAGVFLSIIVLATMSGADTTWVSGGDVYGQWTRDGSPYMIQGSVTVAAGDSLLIGPGVTIFFSGHFGLLVEPSGLIRGEGSVGDSVRFSTDTLLNPERWVGLTIREPSGRVSFSYCIFEYAGDEAGSGSALCIQNGNADIHDCSIRYNRFPIGEGGGLSVHSGSLNMSRCHFSGNVARNGGAAAIFFCSAQIESSTFNNNLGSLLGGAVDIWVYPGTPVEFTACHFTENRCIDMGGAVVAELCGPIFRDCVFALNHAARGGAVYGWFSRGISLEGCLITDNQADTNGGGIYDDGSSETSHLTTIRGCVIARNDAQEGGGIYIAGGRPIIQNCSILENSCAGVGAGLYYYLSAPSTPGAIMNTIIAFNAPGYGLACSSNPWIRHCALFGNAAGSFYVGNSPYQFPVHRVNANGDSCDARFNLYLDPRFVDSNGGDYHLTRESPCIDAGDPESPLDPDSTVADIGAFYFPQPGAVESPAPVVRDAALLHSYPNPFNATTVIEYNLAARTSAQLAVYNLLGRRTAVLRSGEQEAGSYSIVWNAEGFPSGIYLAVLETAEDRLACRMLLLR